jgi:hypothetical protein
VLTTTEFKRDEYFVGFGATDCMSLNNSYLLKKGFAWEGILAEPVRMWHKDPESNRKACISISCFLCDSDGDIEFVEASIPELSTVEE